MSASKKRKTDESGHRIECLGSFSRISQKTRTSRNTFLNFMVADKPNSAPTWERLTADDFTFDNMRRFSSYLFNKTDMIESTAQNYLSSIRSQVGPMFNYRCELQSGQGANDRWKQLKADLKRHYNVRKKQCIDEKLDAVEERAPCMSMTDYNEVSFSLFKQLGSLNADLRKLSLDRNLIVHAWTLAARPYELGTVSYSGYRINPNDKILRGRIFRTKAFRLQTLTLPCAPMGYPHISYAVDPAHALGTYMVLGEQEGVLPGACVFPFTKEFTQPLSSLTKEDLSDQEDNASRDEGVDDDEDDDVAEQAKVKSDPFAGYITKVLAANVPSSSKKYTSYSTRRGVLQQMGDATDSLRHADVAVRSGQINTMQANDTFDEHDNKAG